MPSTTLGTEVDLISLPKILEAFGSSSKVTTYNLDIRYSMLCTTILGNNTGVVRLHQNVLHPQPINEIDPIRRYKDRDPEI